MRYILKTLLITSLLLAVSIDLPAQDDIYGNIDTLIAEPYEIDARNWAIKISLVNDEEIFALCIPLTFSAGIDNPIVADSTVFKGGRAEAFRVKFARVDTVSQCLTIGLINDIGISVPPIPQGEGKIATVFVSSLDKKDIPALMVDSTTTPPGNSLSLITSTQTGPVAFMPCFVVRTATDVEYDYSSTLPETFSLFQNYPNPFNAETIIKFEIPSKSHITLSVRNIMGQEVIKLLEQQVPAGQSTLHWNGRDHSGHAVSSGVYILQLKSDKYDKSIKAVLMK